MSEARPLITTVSVPDCLLCGKPGAIARDGLADELFGAPGAWSFLRCAEDGLWWLSPRPRKQDLRLVYANYYTHLAPVGAPSGIRAMLGDLIDAMLAVRFGYPERTSSSLLRGLARALVRLPAFADIAGAHVMWLPSRPGKRLLDVGSGAGVFAARMLRFGWEVVGIEPDPAAARQARETYGFPVLVGSAEEVTVPRQSYDAVTAAHVVEHVTDPVAFLSVCWSLVRPGGTLVVVTPNLESQAHRAFGRHWRGLEPPRHLTLFSLGSLRLAAERAGLEGAALRTSARTASFMWLMSDALKRHHGSGEPLTTTISPVRRLRALAFLIREALSGDAAGEELVLTATRPAHSSSGS